MWTKSEGNAYNAGTCGAQQEEEEGTHEEKKAGLN